MNNSISEKLFIKYLDEEKQFLNELDVAIDKMRNSGGFLPEPLRPISQRITLRLETIRELTND